jgi:DNA repair protein RecO (recombination protein O)
LHKRWSGDTSAHVTFFTREKGVVTALCKGARTPNKQSLLQAFTPLWVHLDALRDWFYVQKIEVSSASIPLIGQNLFAGLYVNELLYLALRPQDANGALYDAYKNSLHALSAITGQLAIEMVLRRFEWALLEACGYSISLTHDMTSTAPIVAERYYTLIINTGFVLAEQGISGAHIIALAEGRLDDPAVLKSAKWIMRRVIDHALGGQPIKSRELYY